MDAVGNPIDIRSLGAGPLENAMERDDAPGVEINSRAPDCLDIGLQAFRFLPQEPEARSRSVRKGRLSRSGQALLSRSRISR